MSLNNWRELKLGDFVTLQRGHDLPEPQRRAGRVPILGSFGITGYHDEALAKGPGVTVGRSGASFGVVCFSPVDYWPLNTCLYVIDFHGNDERFSYYFLKSRNFSAFNSGSAQPSLNRNFLHPIQVRVPPHEEQVAIANLLRTLDDKIELNRKINETLEGIARAIFKSWFVDFDPVRAKLEGRQPYGMDAETAALFPSKFQQSALGEIPAGWDVGPLLNQAKLLSGGTPKTDREDYWGGHIPWASATDVSRCRQTFLVGSERTITSKGLEESAAQLIPAFCTVVVARGATTGRMVLFGHKMAMNQTCYALASKIGTPFALYCGLRHSIDDLVHAAHGSVFDTITTSTFTNSKVVLAPTSTLEAFDAAASPLFGRILANTEESRTLAAIRDTLLPKLISGEIRLSNESEALRASVGES